jgi:hypothetical protein
MEENQERRRRRIKSQDPIHSQLPELCSFLGLAKFYRRFVLGFSHITWALSQVTKGGVKAKFLWFVPQQKTFKDMK